MDTKEEILTDDIIKLAQVSKLLSHPIRLFIVLKLSKMNACCYSGDLSEELNIARSTLSQHLKELKYGGIIQGEIEGPFIKYCLNKQNWETIKELFKELLIIK
ncbi:MAG: metalloregulator ArsR/SmtB family transcription factor [Bacteroidales bacterium]|nr:metalloregulator ArsR/SmtB family transcription factor [Bacteroidales bacterium]